MLYLTYGITLTIVIAAINSKIKFNSFILIEK